MSALLDLLKDGRFHSGQALGDALGISRSAVWKQLQQLQSELDIPIHKVRGRGYQLADPISLLDAPKIALDGPQGWTVRVHDTVDSTNAEALRAVAQGAEMPLLILAERQTSGRGRRGRPWASPYGENLYYSLALRMEGGMARIEGLSLVVGLAVLEALREHGIHDAGLKWPNDVLVDGSKLAGILLELVGDPGDVCHVVIGIGVNVNMKAAISIDQEWTSVRLQSARLVDRSQLAVSISRSLEAVLERHARLGFAQIRDEWESHHVWQGKVVTLTSGARCVQGVALGVDAQGALRLEVDGVEQSFSGGELSLRLSTS